MRITNINLKFIIKMLYEYMYCSNLDIWISLSVCKLREDGDKLESAEFECLPAETRREKLMRNARYTFDDYFLAPPTSSVKVIS